MEIKNFQLIVKEEFLKFHSRMERLKFFYLIFFYSEIWIDKILLFWMNNYFNE